MNMGSADTVNATSLMMAVVGISVGTALTSIPTIAAADVDGGKEEEERSPSTIDSDGDGLWDIEEDLNQNHRVDRGETDPNDPDTGGDGMADGEERDRGTDPAHNGLIDFPEPMVFDMVRGLGAEQGEIELNTLVLVPTSTSWAFVLPRHSPWSRSSAPRLRATSTERPTAAFSSTSRSAGRRTRASSSPPSRTSSGSATPI